MHRFCEPVSSQGVSLCMLHIVTILGSQHDATISVSTMVSVLQPTSQPLVMLYVHTHPYSRLLATLGSRSQLRRVNRKAIVEVDVPRACDTIVNPQAPLALRLQGNLLYVGRRHAITDCRFGVTRVFSQQSTYVLSDAQTAQSQLRALQSAVRTSILDPQAGQAR